MHIDPFTLFMILLGLMLLLLFLGMPVGFAMCLVGFVGLWYLTSLQTSASTFWTQGFNTVQSYVTSAIPIFLLMGEFAAHSGLSQKLYGTAHKWVGHVPGGLAISTTLGAGGFGAISGSGIACAATMAAVAYPEMKRYGYDKSFATGCYAAVGPLASLIPPSVGLMIYAVLTEQSIGKMFIAGIIPGLIEVVIFCIGIYLWARLRPNLAPRVPSASWKERLISLKDVWIVLAVFLLVVGGIYGGIFTATEAASVGAFALFLVLLFSRAESSRWRALLAAFDETLLTAGALLLILVGSGIFTVLVARTQAPTELAALVASWNLSKYELMAAISVLLIILGMFIPPIPIQFMVVPVTFPIVVAAGWDAIVYGIIMQSLLELGMITPPVGMTIFAVHSRLKGEVSFGEIVKGILPFIPMYLIVVAVLIAFPQVTLFLPKLMRGK